MGVIAHRQVFMAATTLTYVQLNCSLPLTTSTLPDCHIIQIYLGRIIGFTILSNIRNTH